MNTGNQDISVKIKQKNETMVEEKKVLTINIDV